MRKVIEEIKRVNTEKIMSVDEVIEDLIDYLDEDYFSESYDEKPMSIDDYKDEVKDILTYSLDIEYVSDEELEEIVDKTYSIFVDKFNKFRDDVRKYEESLFETRDNIIRELGGWFDYTDLTVLTLSDVIDLIIKNGNK